MLASTASRAAARQVLRTGSRGFHSTTPAQGAGGYDYLHAKYMYNLRFKPAGKLTAALLIGGGVATGIGIPLYAVHFNQKKAGLV